MVDGGARGAGSAPSLLVGRRGGNAGTAETSDEWTTARVVAVRRETARATTFRLDLGRPSGHRAGQHYKVRVPSAGGARPSRSYSVASAPDGSSRIEITVERLDGGAVSGVLHGRVRPGDELEIRGPRGRFVWDGTTPALLVGGGSGLVPLMSMLRLARRTGQSGLVRLVAAARTPHELLYREELAGPETTVVYSRGASGSLGRAPGRILADDLAPSFLPDATAYVCGSSGFADSARRLLEAMGMPAGHVRVEAFGPTAAEDAQPAAEHLADPWGPGRRGRLRWEGGMQPGADPRRTESRVP